MCRAAAVKKAFQTEKVGSVGGSFTGMVTSSSPTRRYKNDIGVEVQYMTTEVVKEYLPKVTEEEIDAELAYDAAHYDSDITFQAEYREATRSGLAVRKWMQDNGLHAATVNFLYARYLRPAEDAVHRVLQDHGARAGATPVRATC